MEPTLENIITSLNHNWIATTVTGLLLSIFTICFFVWLEKLNLKIVRLQKKLDELTAKKP